MKISLIILKSLSSRFSKYVQDYSILTKFDQALAKKNIVSRNFHLSAEELSSDATIMKTRYELILSKVRVQRSKLSPRGGKDDHRHGRWFYDCRIKSLNET